MATPLSDEALDTIFNDARSYNGWREGDVSEADIARIYELVKMGPTSANSQPGRFVWCKSAGARERLAKHASEGNKKKILGAPVCVIVGFDTDFHDELPWLFPHTDARSWFEGDPAGRETHAFRNSSLQGAYLMIAARALGFDCGPMSGFDNAAVDKEFFADDPKVKSNFICSIGYGEEASIFARSPRPDFAKFNQVL